MKIVDTHSHIYLSDFEEDFESVIRRAADAGIDKILLPNIELETWSPLLRCAEHHQSFLYPMIGLHPSSVKEDYHDQLLQLYDKLKIFSDHVVAIGETGIDLYWDTSTLEQQIHSFDRQIQWALEFDLPIVIHSRLAFREIFQTLEPYRGKGLRGVFHCFTGTREDASWIVDFGFYMGIGGVVTYKKSDLPEILADVPKNRIVLETDAPYLSPVPYRGRRNEPAYIRHTLHKLAEIWNCSPDTVADITYSNSKTLFPKAW